MKHKKSGIQNPEARIRNAGALKSQGGWMEAENDCAPDRDFLEEILYILHLNLFIP